MAVNKVARGDGSVLIDLSTDTVTSAYDIIAGKVGHLANGAIVTGLGSETLDFTDISASGDGDVTIEGTSGGSVSTDLVLYVIRPDAELIQTYTMDQKAVEDLDITIPAYSTSAQSLKAAENLSPTITVDLSAYRYFVVERFLTIPEYSVDTKGKGRQEYLFCSYMYELTQLAANELPTIIDSTKKITSVQNLFATNTLYRLLYWSSSSAIALYATNQYGAYQTPSTPALSGSTLTIESPALGVRGHATYFTSTYFNGLTDIRYQYVINVYRAPLDNLNIDGWGQDQTLQHFADCINTSDHKLT